jgi:hypothetical protein
MPQKPLFSIVLPWTIFNVVLIEIPWVIFSQWNWFYNGFQFKHHVSFSLWWGITESLQNQNSTFSFIDNGILTKSLTWNHFFIPKSFCFVGSYRPVLSWKNKAYASSVIMSVSGSLPWIYSQPIESRIFIIFATKLSLLIMDQVKPGKLTNSCSRYYFLTKWTYLPESCVHKLRISMETLNSLSTILGSCTWL